jgi:hypothetical protein
METTPKATTESEPETETKPEIKYPHKPNSEATKWRYREDGEIRQATELKARVFQTVSKDLGESKSRVPKVREIVPQGGVEQAPKATRLLLHIE